MFLQLPTELLDDICQHTPQNDLVALSSTHSLLYPIAQRFLYRHLSVAVPSHNTSVVVTLAKKPELARHVRSFAIRLDPCVSFFNTFYRHLAEALSRMTELISLELFVDPTATWVLQGAHHSSYPRLLHFACSFPLDSNVTTFLNKTEALLELEVDAISTHSLPIATLPVASLPRLSQFIGSSHAAQVVVPGRPVESIYLNSGDLTEVDVASLATSTAHVVILGATTSSLPVPLLESLTQYMPHLVYLRIMTNYNFSEAPDVAFYQSIDNALTSFPDLKAFELSGMTWGSSPKTLTDEGRVWQSQPLVSGFSNTHDDSNDDFDPDLFLAY